jgi:pimeloyl-ACP methyl ester carboxylesterase
MSIAANGIDLYVADRGRGEPALLFLHYWGGSSRTWRHVIAALGPGFRTVAVDQRGWGESEKPDSGYALADLADDAQGVIDALGLDRYILVGHSMGGKVAQLLASRRPAGLAGLVLVAPSPPSPLALPLDVRRGMAAAYADRASIVETVEQVLAATTLDPDDLETVIADSLAGASAAKAAWPLAASQEDITAEVAAIAVPTLVISGEKDRVDPPAVLTRELLTRIPQATLHICPGIGHLSPLEAPRDVAELIRTFARSPGPASAG